MKKNILPIEYPPINAFPHQGALFSILFSREECKPWIYSNFIQIYSLKDLYKSEMRSGTIDFFYNIYGDWMNFHLKANPWIKFSSIPMEFINSININFIEFLKTCIDKNYYLFFDVDTYYIAAYQMNYQKIHIPHDIFIYGYDDEKKIFYMGDNTIGKYCNDYVSYDEILLSTNIILEMYSNNKEELFIHNYREKNFNMIQVTRNVERSGQEPLFVNEIYNLNRNKIINDIKEYLLLDNYAESYKHSLFYVYGIDCYNELEKFIIYALNTNQEVDIRAFYSFIEHKKLMLLRIQFLSKDYMLDELVENYKILAHNFNILMCLILKANIKKAKKIWDRAIILLNNCKNTEIMLLNEFIVKIKDN